MPCCAIHAIWTTYGTWLPGDSRGHWSPLYDLYGRLVEQGHKLNLPDPTTEQIAMNRAKEEPKVLTPEEQELVSRTIGEELQKLQPKVEVYAAAIERTHVHLLLNAPTIPIGTLVGKLKGRTSSEVIRIGGEPERSRTWTNGYWKVFVFDVTAVLEIQRYIEAHNVRRGLDFAPYSWISPMI